MAWHFGFWSLPTCRWYPVMVVAALSPRWRIGISTEEASLLFGYFDFDLRLWLFGVWTFRIFRGTRNPLGESFSWDAIFAPEIGWWDKKHDQVCSCVAQHDFFAQNMVILQMNAANMWGTCRFCVFQKLLHTSVWYYMSKPKEVCFGLPSGNQTGQRKIPPIFFADFSSYKPPCTGDFPASHIWPYTVYTCTHICIYIYTYIYIYISMNQCHQWINNGGGSLWLAALWAAWMGRWGQLTGCNAQLDSTPAKDRTVFHHFFLFQWDFIYILTLIILFWVINCFREHYFREFQPSISVRRGSVYPPKCWVEFRKGGNSTEPCSKPGWLMILGHYTYANQYIGDYHI